MFYVLCVLSVVCCLLCVVCCVLSVVCRLLCVVCCVSSVVCRLLCVVCCVLSVVCCVLCVVCCVLCVVRCALCVVCCVLCVVRFALCVVRCLIASICVGFLLSSVAAKRTLGSGRSFLVTVHRSCKVKWYQLSLGCPTLFFPWSISVRSSGSRVTFVPGSEFPAVISLHKY